MGKHLPKAIRLDRERKRLEQVALDRGFDSLYTMLHQYYVIEGKSMPYLARNLVTPLWSLRHRLVEAGVEIKSRGGRNNVRVEITPELIEEVSRDGITATCDRLGIDPVTLGQRLRRYVEEKEDDES